MRVTVNAGGREVTIETSDTNVTPEGVAKIAMQVWEQTSTARDRDGPPYGFASQERIRDRSGWALIGQGEQPAVNARIEPGV